MFCLRVVACVGVFYLMCVAVVCCAFMCVDVFWVVYCVFGACLCIGFVFCVLDLFFVCCWYVVGVCIAVLLATV